MKIVEDQLKPYQSGGRSVEIPFIHRMFKDVIDKDIADFGCLNENVIGTPKYNINPQNHFTYFDIGDVPSLQGKYHIVDLTTSNFYKNESFDYGLSVSVVEHIGLNIYGNTIQKDGDLIAIKNMFDTIKSGGTLYITVPASDVYQQPLGWIRSYTPQMIADWKSVLPNSEIIINLFRYINGDWYQCEPSEFVDVIQYSGGMDIVGIACVKIRKN